MRPSYGSNTISVSDRGFTLVELLVVIVVSALLMAAFTGFYVSEQRAAKHHQIEVETSQGLRTALDQMSRDLRSARLDLSGSANPQITQATSTLIEFFLDADDDGNASSTDSNEHKGYALVGTDLLKLDAATAGATWTPNDVDTEKLTENVSALSFTYRKCDDTTFTPANQTDRDSIAAVDISVTVTRQVIGGLPVSRTESESVRLRNKFC